MFVTNIRDDTIEAKNRYETLETTPHLSLEMISLSGNEKLQIRKHLDASYFYYVEAGNGVASILVNDANESVDIGIGDCVLVKPNQTYSIVASSDGLKMYTLITPLETSLEAKTEVELSDSSVIASLIDYTISKYKFSPLYYIISATKDLLAEGLIKGFDIINILTVLEGGRVGTMITLDENWPFPIYSSNISTEDMSKYIDHRLRDEDRRLISTEYVRIWNDKRSILIATFQERLRKFFKKLQLVENYSSSFYIYNEELYPNFESYDNQTKLGYLCPKVNTIKPLYSYKVIVTDNKGYKHTLFTVSCKDDPESLKKEINSSTRRIGRVISKYGLEVSSVINKQ